MRSAARRSARAPLSLDDAQLAHALGIAEYWGPRGQILRVCESPTMLKDGSSWGAHAGVTAALLAARRLHRRARAHGRARAPTYGRISARAGASASSTSRPIRCAAGRSPRSRRRLRFSASTASPTPTSRRSRSRASARRSTSGRSARIRRLPTRRSTAFPYPVAAALVLGNVGAREIAAAGRDARVARLLSRHDADRGRRIFAALSRRALGARAHHAARRPHARVRAGAGARRSRRIR